MTASNSFRLSASLFLGLFFMAPPAFLPAPAFGRREPLAQVRKQEGGVAADWPSYRHDNARTGCTSESLAAPLVLRWVYTPVYPPRPAWLGPAKRPREGFKLRHRVIFDDAFQVAAGPALPKGGAGKYPPVCTDCHGTHKINDPIVTYGEYHTRKCVGVRE